jgi:glycosyltransferase involved in cell wall biosynthesis
MIRTYAKRLFWLFATSEIMLIRRPAWRFLRLYELVNKKDKPLAPGKKALPDPEEDSIRREHLIHLYETTTHRRNTSAESEPTGFCPQSQRGKCAVILVPSLPRHDRTSSGLRIHCVLKAISCYFDSIHLVHDSIAEDDPVYKRTYPKNLRCHYMPFRNGKVEKFLASMKPEILFVTDLFDPQYIQTCAGIIKTTKSAFPDCFVILDTMDCHWKKYVRKAQTSANQEDWNAAWRYLELEKQLYPDANLLTVVTNEDGEDITRSIPKAPQTAVLPNCYTLSPRLPSYEETSDLCFVGPASVNHNLDAMRYMRDEILPHLLGSNNDIKVFVIGSSWQLYSKEFTGSSFVFRGHVADLDKELSKFRVFVCPLTYGAGLKGKLGSAASAGIPVVSTSIGCEGYPISSAHECLISDDPEVFAQHCKTLLKDKDQWETKRNQIRAMMKQNYGPQSLEMYVTKILEVYRGQALSQNP